MPTHFLIFSMVVTYLELFFEVVLEQYFVTFHMYVCVFIYILF